MQSRPSRLHLSHGGEPPEESLHMGQSCYILLAVRAEDVAFECYKDSQVAFALCFVRMLAPWA